MEALKCYWGTDKEFYEIFTQTLTLKRRKFLIFNNIDAEWFLCYASM